MKPVIRGIGLEILQEMKNRMEPAFQAEWKDILDWVPIDSEILKKMLDEKMADAGGKGHALYRCFQ